MEAVPARREEVEDHRRGPGWLSAVWPPLALLGVVGVVLVVAQVMSWDERLTELRGWIESWGWLAPVVFGGIYIVVTLVGVPGAPLTALAGVAFGPVVGVASVSVASLVSAGAAFGVTRYFGRDRMKAWLKKHERMRRLDRLVEREGVTVVAAARLVTVLPFALLNYAFGLTRVPGRTYLLWTWVGMLPGTVVIVVGAAAIGRAVGGGGVPWGWIVVVVAVKAGLLVSLPFAHRKLRDDD